MIRAYCGVGPRFRILLAMRHLEELTAAELRVLELMAQAGTNGDIAVQLGVSRRTVESQVQSILRKLDLPGDGAVDRRVSAVLIYLRESRPERDRSPLRLGRSGGEAGPRWTAATQAV